MFKIFRRRKDKPALTYGVMQYLSNVVERRQRKIAGYLNRKTKDYSRKKWMLLLFIFCGAMAGIATAILVAGIHDKHNKDRKQNSITVPSWVLRQGNVWDSLQLMEEIYRHRKDSIFNKQNVHH